MKADSAIMKRQGWRATILTLLAAIYFPLSLVTSIFGMNIQEITTDDNNPVARHAGIVFAVVLGATLLFLLGYVFWNVVSRRRRDSGREEEDIGYKIA